jgi:hypothetical protein
MPKAVFKNGVLQLVDPIPSHWKEGREVWIEDIFEDEPIDVEAIDKWYAELEASVAQNDPKDFEIVEAALKEADEIEKRRMRREMGL